MAADQNFGIVRNSSECPAAVWEKMIGPRSPLYTAWQKAPDETEIQNDV